MQGWAGQARQFTPVYPPYCSWPVHWPCSWDLAYEPTLLADKPCNIYLCDPANRLASPLSSGPWGQKVEHHCIRIIYLSLVNSLQGCFRVYKQGWVFWKINQGCLQQNISRDANRMSLWLRFDWWTQKPAEPVGEGEILANFPLWLLLFKTEAWHPIWVERCKRENEWDMEHTKAQIKFKSRGDAELYNIDMGMSQLLNRNIVLMVGFIFFHNRSRLKFCHLLHARLMQCDLFVRITSCENSFFVFCVYQNASSESKTHMHSLFLSGFWLMYQRLNESMNLHLLIFNFVVVIQGSN